MSDLSGLSSSIHQVRAREVQINEFKGGLRRFAVEVPTVGFGSVVRQIWFPSSYVEKPLHSASPELISNHSLNGVAPNTEAIILSWNTELLPESNVLLYQGCRMKFYVQGSNQSVSAYLGEDLTDLSFSFTVFFEGRSITRPGKV